MEQAFVRVMNCVESHYHLNFLSDHTRRLSKLCSTDQLAESTALFTCWLLLDQRPEDICINNKVTMCCLLTCAYLSTCLLNFDCELAFITVTHLKFNKNLLDLYQLSLALKPSQHFLGHVTPHYTIILDFLLVHQKLQLIHS
jgi:hypothetical protein